MLATLLRRLLGTADHHDVPRERRTLAEGLERIVDDARRPATLHWAPPLIRRDVAAACAAAAAALAAGLRDPTVRVGDGTLAAVREFLTEGSTSPLFGDDPWAAELALAELDREVFRQPAPDRDQPPSGRKR